MLLLKYPPPGPPHCPQTFVDDAIYLRDNFSAAGGAKIISKYSGKPPSVQSSTSRPSTPLDQALSPKQRFSRTRSPLPSPARFLQQQGGFEGLFQGATKNVLDRGERLGINQAVRDAVDEVKKNMQGLQSSRVNSSARIPEAARWSLDDGQPIPSPKASILAINQRNRQLAQMLDNAMKDLRAASVAKGEEKEDYIKAVGLAIAKVDFVKIYLEDPTMPLPLEPPHDSPAASLLNSPPSPIQRSLQGTPSKLRDPLKPGQETKEIPDPQSDSSLQSITTSNAHATTDSSPADVSTGEDNALPEIPQETAVKLLTGSLPIRPTAPVPTRSSIAQSSFSYMFEPDDSSATSPKSSSPFPKTRKPTSGPSRSKAAFLFGEDGGESKEASARLAPLVDTDETFSLGSISGAKDR
jgi:TBC1 domain family protein 5